MTSDARPEYPAFGVTADLVVLAVREGRLCVALVRRRDEPYAGRLALPGGFVSRHGLDDTLEETALRELREETGIEPDEVHLEQVKTYWRRGRDPRQEVVTVAWLALGPIHGDLRAGSDAASADWYPVEDALAAPLAFDHDEILRDAVERARAKLEYTDIAASFVPEPFTIADVRRVYETVWGVELDPGNFQRKIAPVFERVEGGDGGDVRSAGRGRPAALYRRRRRGSRAGADLTPIEPPFRRPETGG
ncbi:8-oxo-dGTP diphosphatase [Salana multivorans]|uniref:8-oxo-dGTP diphosphatase n=1 Tax=Salana multivorans TaxID=120377 RepID=A0A3N2D1M2_9MICO|nr:NUDIX domain-containing protein [Salana multivorans]ROR93374.1 8-oxo-dGTP diphosphatase [Salana multivorans]